MDERKEKNIKRSKNEEYKNLVVTNCESKKPGYVFISYKSDSWKLVVSKIVYDLQKQYGLRVYFDKNFARKPEGWISQFTKNMRSAKCKAFLCFIGLGCQKVIDH